MSDASSFAIPFGSRASSLFARLFLFFINENRTRARLGCSSFPPSRQQRSKRKQRQSGGGGGSNNTKSISRERRGWQGESALCALTSQSPRPKPRHQHQRGAFCRSINRAASSRSNRKLWCASVGARRAARKLHRISIDVKILFHRFFRLLPPRLMAAVAQRHEVEGGEDFHSCVGGIWVAQLRKSRRREKH